MNIVIVDDDILVSNALKTILETDGSIVVSALGHNGMDAVRLYETYLPEVLLMDIRMDGMNGLDASAAILKSHPDAKILLLTTFSDDEYIITALKLGTKGYLLKQDYESILPALQAVSMGQTVFGHAITSKLPNLLLKKNTCDFQTFALYDINEREFELIKLVADGQSNREIAEHLFLSEGTIRNYLSLILDKLELRDRTQLAIFYYQHMKT